MAYHYAHVFFVRTLFFCEHKIRKDDITTCYFFCYWLWSLFFVRTLFFVSIKSARMTASIFRISLPSVFFVSITSHKKNKQPTLRDPAGRRPNPADRPGGDPTAKCKTHPFRCSLLSLLSILSLLSSMQKYTDQYANQNRTALDRADRGNT